MNLLLLDLVIWAQGQADLSKQSRRSCQAIVYRLQRSPQIVSILQKRVEGSFSMCGPQQFVLE